MNKTIQDTNTGKCKTVKSSQREGGCTEIKGDRNKTDTSCLIFSLSKAFYTQAAVKIAQGPVSWDV